jgi:hypothetical protein
MARLIAGFGIAAALVASSAAEPARRPASIADVMKQAHLTSGSRATRNNLDSLVIDGKATAAQQQQLLELYQALAQAKPPRGKLEDWQKRTGEMVTTVQAVIKGEEKAAERLTRARDCKACHDLHRGTR